MSLSPERLAEIRALGDDELRTVIDSDQAIDDLLTELDRVRESLRGQVAVLHRAADGLLFGGPSDEMALRRVADGTALRRVTFVLDEITGGA